MADQASKAWAVKTLRFGDERVVIRGFFQFIYTENPGIAFGQLQEGGSFGRWFFVVLAVLAAIAVFITSCARRATTIAFSALVRCCSPGFLAT
jgi:lipoprotein signal peptidase